MITTFFPIKILVITHEGDENALQLLVIRLSAFNELNKLINNFAASVV